MNEKDLFDRLVSGRDSVRKLQQTFARMAMTDEQRQVLADGMARMIMPGDQIQTMIDLIDAFGPPHAQIEALREEIALHRSQLEEAQARLAHIETTVVRLAGAAEQIAAFQEPFVKFASAFIPKQDEPTGGEEEGTEE